MHKYIHTYIRKMLKSYRSKMRVMRVIYMYLSIYYIYNIYVYVYIYIYIYIICIYSPKTMCAPGLLYYCYYQSGNGLIALTWAHDVQLHITGIKVLNKSKK